VSNLDDKLPNTRPPRPLDNVRHSRAVPRDPAFGPFRDGPRLVERGRLRIIGRLALVRAGSVRYREPLVLDGHERSPSAHRNPKSHGIHRSDLS
jgi:hypothetical protein